MNTCWAPHLKMSPKCFLMATIALISAFWADPLSLVGACISIFFIATSFFLPKVCMSWKHNFVATTFVTTNMCLSRFSYNKSMLVATKHICHNKHVFVTSSICHDKTLVTTNIILSWQAYFCHDKRHVLCLSWQTCVCCSRTFVAYATLIECL